MEQPVAGVAQLVDLECAVEEASLTVKPWDATSFTLAEKLQDAIRKLRARCSYDSDRVRNHDST